METNPQIELAAKIIEQTGCSLFLTGKAGTGKTTFLRNLRTRSRKRMVVCAPTGIAAINAGGMTLHSFFQLDFGIFVPGMARKDRRQLAFNKQKIKMIRGLDLLVIDEVSMVRADLLDAVDDVLRRYRDHSLPFGGVQLLLIGDLQQLPPVVTDSERAILEANYRSPYFFDSHALSQMDYLTIELNKVYRQTDGEFLNLLNAVRDNRADAEVLAALNRRHITDFHPADSEGYVRLTTHNHLAESVNRQRIAALHGEPHSFSAKVTGNFPQGSYPADPELTLKEGAQVMFIKNDTGADRRFFNGMMGKVTTIDDEGIVVTPDDGSDPINVEPAEWENLKFEIDEETNEISQKIDGVFSQLPLKLAWAITIHKSQGLTFDHAIIDASAAFSHGQTYVALSRCRTLEGLVLERPLLPHSIISDPTVRNFINTHAVDELAQETVDSMIHAYQLHLAAQMFNFRPIFNSLEGLTRIYGESFIKLYPRQVQDYTINTSRMKESLIPVGDKFAAQLARIDAQSAPETGNPQLLQRIKDASRYFLAQLNQLLDWTDNMPDDHDNRNIRTRLRERMELFAGQADMRSSLLSAFAEEDFSVDRYLDLKAKGAFGPSRAGSPSRTGSPSRAGSASRTHSPSRGGNVGSDAELKATDDNLNPLLLRELTQWRNAKAQALNMIPSIIARTKTLLAISNHLPADINQLASLPGVGRLTAITYGDEMLDIVDEYRTVHPEAKAKEMPKPKPKLPKGASAMESYKMWLAGKSIEEIATERGLAPTTIQGHVALHVPLDNDELMQRIAPIETIRAVRKWCASNDIKAMGLNEANDKIAEALGEAPGFFIVRAFQKRT